MSGADGDESRGDKNKILSNEKIVDLFKEYNLMIVRDSRRKICLSPILDTFLDKVHDTMLNDKDVETSEHHNSFPIAQNLDILPSFARYHVHIILSGDNDGAVENFRKSKDILPKPRLLSIPQLQMFFIRSI